MRTGRTSRAAAGAGALAATVWDRMVASDPGLPRLLLAMRGTAAVVLTTCAAMILGRALGASPVLFAAGITFSMMAPFLMREPTRRRRERTLVWLALPAVAATLATAALHGHQSIGDCYFLGLVFIVFLLQARSPMGIGLGLVAVVTSYVGLYLELPLSSLPVQLLSIAVSLPVVWLACFALVPLRPDRILRRTLQAVRGRAALVAQAVNDLAAGKRAAVNRLRHSLGRLNEAALAADDQFAALEPSATAPLRLHLMDLELAAARLATLPLEPAPGQARERRLARLQAQQRRLRRGRGGPYLVRAEAGSPRSAIARALGDMLRAAAALGQDAMLPPVSLEPAAASPPGPLAWRVALRVTLASALAMAGGMALSPQRWFWAVITTYVVFLGARSRGDTIYKGVQRMGGTLLGLVAGVTLGTLLDGDPAAETVALLAAVFGMYYFFVVSYTVGIFCVTVLLSLLYGMLGASVDSLLLLRLEETVIGAAAAILVAVFVLPVRTRDQVRNSGTAVLRALENAVGTCRRALAGEPGALPIPAMRAVDRQVADLRLALLPLTAGRALLRRSELERPVPALLECVHWARVLAVAATAADPAAAAQADAIERRLAALAQGDRSVPGTPPPLARPARAPAHAALDRLDRATAVLAERLAIGALHGFRLEG